MVPTLWAAEGFSIADKSAGFSWLNLVAPILFVFFSLAVIFIVYMIYLSYRRTKLNQEEWDNLDGMIESMQLSREEAAFIKRSLKKLRYKNPTHVLKKQDVYERFTKKMLKRPNHHVEFLLAVIKQKAFDNKKKPTPSSKPTPSKTTE